MIFPISSPVFTIWKERRGGNGRNSPFSCQKEEIADNDYDLSINKYKKIEYVPVEYPPTEEILANLRNLETQIQQEMDELAELLKK